MRKTLQTELKKTNIVRRKEQIYCNACLTKTNILNKVGLKLKIPAAATHSIYGIRALPTSQLGQFQKGCLNDADIAHDPRKLVSLQR